jgi:ParB-like chromosome segregation protein Spo0J
MPTRKPPSEQKNWVAYQPTHVWPIDRVLPNPGNSRRHTEEQVRRISESIQTYGWTIPLLVDETDVLITGEGRWLGGKRLGLLEVPVKIAKGWSPAMIRAYVIADNRLSEMSSWDDSTLARELAELLGEESLDVTATGFERSEIDKLLDPGESLIDVREIKTGPVEDRFWISVRGPLALQALVLDVMKAAVKDHPQIELDVGSVAIGD